jgi:hypothetical protein
MSTPLATVKTRFESKEKLIAALKELATDDVWIDRLSKRRGASDKAGKGGGRVDKALGHVSNAKLLKLHATLSLVRNEFGTRGKLIDAILELERRDKDAGYRKRLEEWTVPRLYDAYRSLKKRAGGAP